MMQDVDLDRCCALFSRHFDDECLENDDCFYEELIRRLDLETFDLPNMLVLNKKAWEVEELMAKRGDLTDDEATGQA